ncbi:TIGR04222 domain-containing membrane protein [Streptomyces sp. NBC_01353]|uniref:TIGR04222 domain-containing membrane protein n=1 Tax=Streptomyces sp. NBC_01353 TaxID=2903835 RepID=UPI002E33A071|nr:TIGR04222 domain-containing membrane protein [Streptomyces sp. NBC_01353]
MNLLALIVWAAVLVTLGMTIAHVRAARADHGGSVHDLAEAAFLLGGPPRVVDTALATLHAEGLIGVGGPGLVVVLRPDLRARDHVGRAVLEQLAAAPSGALHELRLAVMRGPAVQEIGDGLAARGMMVAPEDRLTGKRWCLALGFGSFGLLVVSIALSVGVAREPFEVPFFFKVVPVLFAGIIVALVCGAYNAGRTTLAGRRAAAEYRAAHVYFPDAAHQVGLRGLRAVPDTELRTQLIAAARMPRPSMTHTSSNTATTDAFTLAALHWCAGTPGSPGGCGGASGGTGGGVDSGVGGGGCSASACSSGGGGGGSGSGCGSSGGGGSSCGSSSSGGSSCSSSSSSSSCGGGSSG